MNVIQFGDYEFDDNSLLEVKINESNAMISESLSADTLIFNARAGIKSKLYTVLMEWVHTVDNEGYVIQSGFVENYIYGEPVYYYKDEVLQGKFYLSKVTRTGTYTFTVECISAIGLLINIPHVGGVFESLGTTVGDSIRDIFDRIDLVEGTDYVIDSAVDDANILGSLPYSNCRDNLRQILFAVGASIVKEDSGILNIKYLSSPQIKNIPDSKIYLEGNISSLNPVSAVEVLEHTYHSYDNDELVTLFDNTDRITADHELVLFDEPCHADVTTGNWVITGSIEIHEIGANYAIVSGLGTLGGYKYSHTTRVIREEVSDTGLANIIQVQEATLISSINSINATKRIAEYYKMAQEVQIGVVLGNDGLKPSSKVAFTDPFGNQNVGYVKSMDINVSGINKAECVIDCGWNPAFFGNNLNEAHILTEGSSWTPLKSGTARFVLIGGGQGGTGGGKGGNGQEPLEISAFFNPVTTPPFPENAYSNNGLGGEGGQGGNGGKILVFEAEVTEGVPITFSLGEGGSGGAKNGGTGEDGTATEITIDGTTYTSDDGVALENGYTDPLSGAVFGQKGWQGLNGRDGEREPNPTEQSKTYMVQVSPTQFREVTLKNGNHGKAIGYTYMYDLKTNLYTVNNIPICQVFYPAGGGGALCFEAGKVGGDSRADSAIAPTAQFIGCSSGGGGNGSDAISIEEFMNSEYNPWEIEYSVGYGQGGTGGSGGGGGAGSGNVFNAQVTGYNVLFIPSQPSTGGNGSIGCTGGNGAILIYL